MRRLLPLIVLALLVAGNGVSAQAPGDFPHLLLDDKMGTVEPGGGLGPFDNTGAFQIAAGQALEARVSYDSLGQSNDNVLWGLLVSGTQTPFPTTGTPEPLLLTMPPFILLISGLPTLQLQPDMSGLGTMPLFVPPGIVAIETYVQGLVFDITSTPNLRLSNGLKVQITTPDYNVHVAWVQNSADGAEAFLRNVGNTDVDANTLKTLSPLGPMDAPLPDDGVGPPLQVDDFRFLPVLPNVGDDPVNPLARPLTTIRGSVDSATTTIPVYDTTGFPERGRLLVSFGQSNLWANKTGGGFAAPSCEVIHYDGKTGDEFLNCQRSMLGSTGPDTFFPHGDGETVLGFFTMATTSGARGRTRVGLDVDNVDMPHVVIPPFTVDDTEGVPVTMDLDLYLYETKVNKIQGFAVLDRITGQWREIPGTANNEQQGRWDPMVHVAPDGRSFVAALKRPGGLHNWDNLVDNLVAIRLDETNWKATGTPVWAAQFQVGPDPPTILTTNVRSREIFMPSVAIIGPDPDNYVLFAGLKHKWQQNPGNPGSNYVSFEGFESEYTNEEVIVRDFIDVPLVMESSVKSPPAEPRPYITTDFGFTGLNNTIIRFDPAVLASPSHEELLVTAGSEEKEEDVYLVKDVSVSAGGEAVKAIVNLSGYNNGVLSVGQTRVRPFYPGGHGQGRKAAFSADGSIVAWLAEDAGKIRDWIDIGFATGSSSGKVGHTYQDAGGVFQEEGELRTDRAVAGLRWLDNDRLICLMGRQRYSDPIAANPANFQAMDLFVYDRNTDLMTNLTGTEETGNGFGELGKINPAGYFAAEDGSFTYFIRSGGISDVGGSALPAETPVTNIVGLNSTTLNVFNATGDEFAGSSPIANLELSDDELGAPTEAPLAMRFTEGYGQQDGLLYFTAHRQGGNGADDVLAFHREIPFIAFEVTSVTDAGSHISNLVPNPFGNTVAFARTQGTDRDAADQHPFVVDLNNFLFVRDLAPALLDGSNNFLGRVMDGSLRFVPPSGNASDALVLSMGFFAHPNGISYTATPVYYSLASVSDTAAEPIPLLIPLLTTAGLVGTPWRFYVPYAGLSQAP